MGCGPCPRGEPGRSGFRRPGRAFPLRRGRRGPASPPPAPGAVRTSAPARSGSQGRRQVCGPRPPLPRGGRWPRRRSCARGARPRIPLPALRAAPGGSSPGEASTGRPRRSAAPAPPSAAAPGRPLAVAARQRRTARYGPARYGTARGEPCRSPWWSPLQTPEVKLPCG